MPCDVRGMKTNPKIRLLVAASLGALALGAAACGSSSNGGTATAGTSASGTVNGAGSTFAAPVYQQWGSTLKGKGVTLNYQAVGSGAGVAALGAGTANFAGSDPALAPGGPQGAARRAPPVQVPMFFGAITVAYNVNGLRQGPQARRPDGGRHLPRQDHELERPGDREAEPRRQAARHEDHGRPPLRRVGHDEGLHDLPRRLQQRVEERRSASTRPSSGRPAPAPRATTASPPRSSRPTARSATSSRPTRCRTTSRRPTSRTGRASSWRRRSRRPRRPATA